MPIVLAGFAAIAQASPNLELYWSFDDAVGSAVGQDGSANNRDATINAAGAGTPGIQTGGRFGNTLNLNNNAGTNAIASGPGGSSAYTGVTGSAARTVSAWIRPTGAADDGIVNWGTNSAALKWNLRTVNNANQFRTEFGNGGVEHSPGPPNLFDGEWHHVVATMPAGGMGSQVQLYIDGVPGTVDLTTSTAILNTSAAQNVQVGTDFSNRHFDGLIDDVGIFSRQLTGAEVEAIYNLAEETALNYDLGQADQVLDVFNSGGSVEIGDLTWVQNDSVFTGLGDVVEVNGAFFLQLNSSGAGVVGAAAVVPEPASIAIWSLLGLAFTGFGYYRIRRKK